MYALRCGWVGGWVGIILGGGRGVVLLLCVHGGGFLHPAILSLSISFQRSRTTNIPIFERRAKWCGFTRIPRWFHFIRTSNWVVLMCT